MIQSKLHPIGHNGQPGLLSSVAPVGTTYVDLGQGQTSYQEVWSVEFKKNVLSPTGAVMGAHASGGTLAAPFVISGRLNSISIGDGFPKFSIGENYDPQRVTFTFDRPNAQVICQGSYGEIVQDLTFSGYLTGLSTYLFACYSRYGPAAYGQDTVARVTRALDGQLLNDWRGVRLPTGQIVVMDIVNNKVCDTLGDGLKDGGDFSI